MNVRMEFDRIEESQRPTQDSSLFDDVRIACDAIDELCGCTGYMNPHRERIHGKLDKLSITPSLIQGVIDAGTDLGRTSKYHDSFISIINHLVKKADDSEIELDFTDLGIDMLSGLGLCYEDKHVRYIGNVLLRNLGKSAKNCTFEADFMSNMGTDASDCIFRTQKTDRMGERMTRCKIYADEFTRFLGTDLSECEVHSKKPFRFIDRMQDGTSRYFVDGVEIAYEYYVLGKYTKGVKRHEPKE